MRIHTELTRSALAERLTELEDREDHAETFRHADGSVTSVHYDFDPSDMESPRDWEGNVSKLVMQSNDYLDLDDRHSAIESALERWGTGESVPIPGWYGSTELVREAADTLTRRYLAMFHPDVLAYEPRWEVSGSSQSDWAYGYAYVLREDWEKAFPGRDPATGYLNIHTGETITPETCIEQEVAVYQQHFAGEYYYAVHLSPEPAELVSTVVDYATEPAETYGDDYSEESCYGFLGYDNLADITQQFTGSEVVS